MKETIMNAASQYWWVLIPILGIIFYKYVLRMFGIIVIPEDKIGLVTKKFVLFGKDKNLPDGKIIALNGEAGFQAVTLAPGLYFWKWPWQYEITLENFTVIPEGHIGLVLANDGIELPKGRILGEAVECDSFQDAEKFLKGGGVKGRQLAYIASGSYRINTQLFHVSAVKQTNVAENMVGIITTLDGLPLKEGQIAGTSVEGHNNFQDFDKFIKAGGFKGLQPQVILAGTYNINPWAVQIEQMPMTEISIGHVGVIISYIGEEGVDTTGETFKHGNLVKKGFKGVWADTLGPGKYPINKYTHKVESVPTTNLVLNWANARTESHSLDKNLSTITVRSKDGFQFNLDVSQIIHIPMVEAPKVIARFGSMNNLVSQVLEPTIGNYFRNSAQGSDVLSFLNDRSKRQSEAKGHIDAVLKEYNVQGVDTLIGDIVPPESIMRTLSDRKIAEEQQITFKAQQAAQETRQKYEKEKSIADIQPQMVSANQGVEIAEKTADAAVKKARGEADSVKLAAQAEAERTTVVAEAEAKKIEITGAAEAAKILAVGKSTAEAYKLQVAAMGQESFSQFKITEIIGNEKIKIMPDVLIGGGTNGGPMEGLLGLKLMEMMGGDKKIKPETPAKK